MPLAMLLGLLAGAGITSVPWLSRAAGGALDSAEATTQSVLAPYWPQAVVLPGHQYRLVTVYLVVVMGAGMLGLAHHRAGLRRLALSAAAGLVLSATAALAVQQLLRGDVTMADASVAALAVVGALVVAYESLGGRMRPPTG